MKTEQEIKQEARQVYFKRYSGFINEQIDLDRGREMQIKCFTAGANWMQDQQPKWIPVTERLPEIGHVVLVQTLYMDKGKPTTDCFSGYMDEYGDLIVHPTDENYGWEFNDCVTHWMPLPDSP